MKNSDVICGALRIVHFEVKEDSGSLTFDGVIPEDVKSFSAILHRKASGSPRALARG